MKAHAEFDADKAILAIAYLASKPEQVTNLDKFKVAKLLFLADKFHIVRWARPILWDEYRALEHGPVPQKTLDIVHALLDGARGPWVDNKVVTKLASLVSVDRSFQYPRFSAQSVVETEQFSVSEIKALDHIISEHGKKGFADLRALTHEFPAWTRAWTSKLDDDSQAPMKYADFFDEDADAIDGALEELREDEEIRRGLSGHQP